jgi:linalool 8-monooxygenase
VRGFPHELFAGLRRSTPVCWSEWSGGAGFWSLLKYEDVNFASRNPRLFSSAAENGGHRIFEEKVAGIGGSGADSPFGTPFISRDPPRHQQQRGVLAPAVAPGHLARMEARIRARVIKLFEAVPAGEAFDVVAALSAPIPVKTLAELLAVEESIEPKLLEWTNALIGEDDPEFRRSPEYLGQVMGELITFFCRLREDRRDSGAQDVISLITRQKDGSEVPLPEFLSNIVLVLVGGNETTRNSISGGLVALAQRPEQWQALRADRRLIEPAVAEIIRWVSPVMHMRRTTTEAVEVRGVQIPKGAKVLMWYPAANRDDEVWGDADAFNIAREGPRHLAFGAGQHVCIGSRLAELQLRIFLEELLERYADVEVAGAIPHIRSNFIDGIRELPMRFTRQRGGR